LPKTEKPSQSSIPEPSQSQSRRYKKAIILVVEDNKINQLIVKKQLDNKGVECDFADDGVQALAYLENKTPDLILMDLQMPNMDGFTASSIIKQNNKFNKIPIVILSASVGKEDKEKASKLGIHDFINKPFQQSDLMVILDKYLQPQPVTSESS
jgi:CheY-like chemotaxis protein